MDDHVAELKSSRFRKSTILPAQRTKDRRIMMGAFDCDDRPINESLLFRTQKGVLNQIGFPGALPPKRARAPGTVIYMGVQFRHFGHFLLEGLSRLWFAKEHPDLPIAWSLNRRRGGETTDPPVYKSWQADILELVGIRNRPIFVSQATTFDEVVVPEPGYRIQDFLHPTHRDLLAVVDHVPEPGRDTWLSRARLDPSKGANRSVGLLEHRLADAGWQIIHPEEMTIAEQMSVLASSERVAGEQGSAFHPLLFLRNTAGLRVDILGRDPGGPPDWQNKNYETIAVSKQLRQTIHQFDSERIVSRQFAAVQKIGQNSFKYLDSLGVPIQHIGQGREPEMQQESKTKPVSQTAHRLTQIAAVNDAKAYLEVGVASGKTFLNVDFALKHAVDPEFLFDTRPFETATTQFFEMTSDEFFVNYADVVRKYDLIFLDGLHTFEQTFRDLCSSMAHSHDKTIWIIDDVVPSDVFSAVPRQRLAYKYRKLNGGRGRAWHGDVFKLIYAIHDFFPNLSYRTVVGQGNPQAVVVRRPRKDFAPTFNDLEAISRLTYFDFLENQPLLKRTKDDELLAWLAE